jgi:F-type H+-transporting ATPase subunit alpha
LTHGANRRGQRELIIGDRQTGKTAVAIDAIINQGQGRFRASMKSRITVLSPIKNVVRSLERRRHGLHHRRGGSVRMARYAHVATYSAARSGEYFRDRGEEC